LADEQGEILASLLLKWEDAWDLGDDIPAEELCAGHPDILEPLRRGIERLKKMAWMATEPTEEPTEDLLAPDPLLGQTFAGRYRAESLVGKGGFGRVYRAFDSDLQRYVAVKVAHGNRQQSPNHLLDEARRVAKLRHPGIVPVHDVGCHDGSFFFVSGLIEGQRLTDLIATARPSPEQGARLVAEVADALDAAHALGFVHRDIKPSNLLIDERGRPLIADFGIATTSGQLASGTEPSSGTLPYMAPEQVAGEARLIGPRTDLHALGAVLYELLTGYRPFLANTTVGLRDNILLRTPKPPREINPEVPVYLEEICLRCLAKHPADRFGSAAELAAALRAGRPIRPSSLSALLLVSVFTLAVLVPSAFMAGRWTRPEAGRTPASVSLELDRRVAEHILQIGGEVGIIDKSGRTRLLFEHDIPETPFVVDEVKVVGIRSFGDGDLSMLVGLPKLASLYVSYTEITDEGMKQLGEIGSLKGIGCGGNRVTAAGIAPLTKLSNLGYLDINNCPLVTDEVFDHLREIPTIRQLDLNRTSVTPEAVERFRASRPECVVKYTPNDSVRSRQESGG